MKHKYPKKIIENTPDNDPGQKSNIKPGEELNNSEKSSSKYNHKALSQLSGDLTPLPKEVKSTF